MGRSAIELQSYIRDRTKNITKDCATFLFFKQKYNGTYHRREDILGGGNLLMAMGLFGALEYLSKIYYVLKTGYENIPNNRNSKPYPIGRPNEIKWERPLSELIRDCPIELGIRNLNAQRLKKFWQNWRNKLAHLLAQDHRWGGVASFDDSTLSFHGAETHIKNHFTSFTRNNGRWECDADKFRMDIEDIAEWICTQVTGHTGARARSTLNWLKRCWK